MLWNAARGRSVVDTSNAESLGELDGLVIDPTEARVVALTSGSKVIDWSDAHGIGTDAVTIDDAGMLRDADTELERAAVDGTAAPLGRKVYTDDGFALGQVLDLEIDPQSGDLEHLVLTSGEVDGSRLIGIGSFAVVISAPDRNGTAVRTEGASRSDTTKAEKSSAGSPSTPDLDGLTKGQLYEIAKERDVEGRSTMNKAQLVDALS